MLLNNKDNLDNNDDFNEINNDISAFQIFNDLEKKQNKPNDELPKNINLTLFLTGFSYTGLLLVSLFWSIFFSLFKFETEVLNILLQTFSYISLLAAIILILYKYKSLVFKTLKNYKGYLIGLAFGALTFVAELLVSNFIYGLFPSVETNSNEVAVQSLITNYPTLMFLITVIIGPICEEVTYRVALFGLLKKNNQWIQIIVSAFVFAFVHISFSDTTVAAELCAFPVYLVIGFMLGLAYKKFGFTCSFTAHSLINFIAFCVSILTTV